MDSQADQVKALLAEAKTYTFETFSIRERGFPEVAGPEKPSWISWKTRVRNVVVASMSEKSGAVRLVKSGYNRYLPGYGADEFELTKSELVTGLETTAAALNDDRFNELVRASAVSGSGALSNRVFVVHGHDDLLKTETENFLRTHGLDPIVLHRQPDQGNTLIEKFELHSDVGYALVLLTPDDVAFPVEQVDRVDEQRSKEFRARQNVILELGYFVGKLGRRRVCCLYKKGVALPGDLSGLVYKNVTDGFNSKAYEILQELKAAGYKVTI